MSLVTWWTSFSPVHTVAVAMALPGPAVKRHWGVPAVVRRLLGRGLRDDSRELTGELICYGRSVDPMRIPWEQERL
jgi:hypothetical protein